MADQDRHLMLTNESIGYGSFFGNITMHMPEQSNKIFKNFTDYEVRELNRVESPQRESRIVPSSSMMIEQINVLAIKEVRLVNSKQWERIMKRRVKREMHRFKKMTQDARLPSQQLELTTNKKYKYQSRHLHAEKRIRNDKGRFIRTKPKPSETAEVVKKKRGRKSKKELEEIRLRQQLEHANRNNGKENENNSCNVSASPSQKTHQPHTSDEMEQPTAKL